MNTSKLKNRITTTSGFWNWKHFEAYYPSPSQPLPENNSACMGNHRVFFFAGAIVKSIMMFDVIFLSENFQCAFQC